MIVELKEKHIFKYETKDRFFVQFKFGQVLKCMEGWNSKLESVTVR